MKIRLKRHFGLSFKDLYFNIAMFCVVTFALLESASISVPIVSMIKNPIMLLGGICILTQLGFFLKVLRKKRYFFIIAMLMLMVGFLFLSAYYNKNPKIGSSPQKDTIRLCSFWVELIFLMIWTAETGKLNKLLNFVFYYMLSLTILTDLLLFTRIKTFSDGHFETYLIGTKFTVVYFHMNLMALWYVKNKGRFRSDKKARRVIYWGMPLAFITSIWVDCMSGLLGCAVLFVLLWIMEKPIQKKLLRLTSHWMLLLAMFVSVLFPFVAESILEIPFVTFVVEDILGRNTDLTGRLNIFLAYTRQMEGHWLWGFGYGNGNIVATTLFGYANAQNALLHWTLQIGVPATLCLVTLLVMIFKQFSNIQDKSRSLPFVALIYMYIILGMVETTFSMSLFMWFGIVFLQNNDQGRISTHN